MSLVNFNDKMREVVFTDYEVSGGWTMLPGNKMGKVLATKGSELCEEQTKVNEFLKQHGLPLISNFENPTLIVDKDLWEEKIEPAILFHRTFEKLQKKYPTPEKLYSSLEKFSVPPMEYLTEKVSKVVLESQAFNKKEKYLGLSFENSPELYRSILDDTLRYDIWWYR